MQRKWSRAGESVIRQLWAWLESRYSGQTLGLTVVSYYCLTYYVTPRMVFTMPGMYT